MTYCNTFTNSHHPAKRIIKGVKKEQFSSLIVYCILWKKLYSKVMCCNTLKIATTLKAESQFAELFLGLRVFI